MNNARFYDCTFQNMLDIGTTAGFLSNCKWFGGRYLDRQSTGLTLENVSAIGVRGQIIFDGKATDYVNVRGLRAVGQNMIVYSYNYSGATKLYGRRLIDLDATGCTNPYISITISGGAYETYHVLAYTMNFKIVDESGSVIQNAIINLKDKDGNEVFSETTDSNGEIAEQVVDTLLAYNNGSANKNYYINTPDVDWTKYYPFTLTISKSGYETYVNIITPTEKINQVITLKTASDVMITNEGLGIKADPTNSTDDRNFLIV